MVPLLRFIAVALLASSSAVPLAARAFAEPLDKDACANLQLEQKKLFTPAMQAALERGPDWVKDHLNDQEIEKVRNFLEVEEMIEFRCRTGVPKPKPPRHLPPGGRVSAEGGAACPTATPIARPPPRSTLSLAKP